MGFDGLFANLLDFSHFACRNTQWAMLGRLSLL
jgi:hypothetical protein